MMRFLSIIFCCFGALLHAGITVTSEATSVFHRGSHEVLGGLTFTVDDDAFAAAGVDAPLYLAIALPSDQQVKLSETLVDLNSGDVSLKLPMNLAVYALDNAGLTIEVPADGVSIVRWVAGESTIWLRIQSSSSGWFTDGQGAFLSPSPGNRVGFGLGLSARAGNDSHGDNTNLPFNTRLTEPRDLLDAYSTILCTDLSQSTVSTEEGLADIFARFTLYESDAAIGGGVFQAGTPASNCCPESTKIGVAVDRDLTISLERMSDQDHIALEDDGLLSLNSIWQLKLASRDTAAPVMHNGSMLHLSLSASSDYGFDPDALSLGTGCSNQVQVIASDAVTIGNRPLFRDITLLWEGGEAPLSRFQLQMEGAIFGTLGNSGDPSVAWSLELVMSDQDPADSSPFTAGYQWTGCVPGSALVASGNLHFGGGDERVLAHVTNPQGTFATSIILTNPSTTTSAAYRIQGYNIDGLLVDRLTGTLLPGERVDTPATLLMNSPELSHLTIGNGSTINMTAVYQALGEGKSPVHVSESNRTSQKWLIYAGNPQLTYDGFALVNLGNNFLQGTLSEYDADDHLISEQEFVNNLPVRGKALVVLQPSSNDAGTYFLIRTNQPCSVMALRGDPGSTYIWENQATALER